MIGKIIIIGIALFCAALAYACCLVAAAADKEAEIMHREYMKRKEKDS
ncbi:MAG: hypothetical protein IJ680_04690 [Paludibacteraceae bacterium]|nr:hypothetical protein [Paludibacteraceae bacterium]